MADAGAVEVVDVAERSRFEVRVDGEAVGFAAYRPVPGGLRFTHTEISDAVAGRGLGGVLVRAALDAASARGLAVVPDCTFVRGWIAKHPEYADLVAT